MVVLEPGANLPEGKVVQVEAEAQVTDPDAGLDPAFKIAELAVDTGIPGLAMNLDPYRYGHPKVTGPRL